jgi:predicted CXXCH cytochrome family protein
MKRRRHPGFGRGRFALLAAGAVAFGAVAVLASGCSTSKHHRVLSFFFDGVPEPEAAVVSTAPEVQATVGRRLVRPGEHGPYAAKLCDSCHDSRATNALVAPIDQLCVRCHQLGETKAYVHGPLASGGCTVCHDPHRSPNRYLLVSASDGFCLDCHDRAALSVVKTAGGVAAPAAGEVEGAEAAPETPETPQIDAHAGDATNCTDCHDAHMSDRKYLLREGK